MIFLTFRVVEGQRLSKLIQVVKIKTFSKEKQQWIPQRHYFLVPLNFI